MNPQTSESEGKVIMSRAARRKLKKPPTVVTPEAKEKALEELREYRKHARLLKSNGARRKVAKLAAKRSREDEEGLDDPDGRPAKKGRRLETSQGTAVAEEDVKRSSRVKGDPTTSATSSRRSARESGW